MSGGAKAMFNGKSKLNAMWNEFERGAANESPKDASTGQSRSPVSTSRHSLQSEKSPKSSTESLSLESTSQQAGRLFSNFSSFLSRKTKEFSQTMEVSNNEGTKVVPPEDDRTFFL